MMGGQASHGAGPMPADKESIMRKIIFMAVAGFLWKKFQARGTSTHARTVRTPRQY
jgi:hypothetical protein